MAFHRVERPSVPVITASCISIDSACINLVCLPVSWEPSKHFVPYIIATGPAQFQLRDRIPEFVVPMHTGLPVIKGTVL